MKNLILFALISCVLGAPSLTSNITSTSDSSGKLTSAEKTCNNVTACVECNENKCYEYDIAAKSCNKVGQRKDTILLLHIFLGSVGVAAFVVGNILFGAIQLGLILSPLLWMWCYCCPCDKKEELIDFCAKGGVCVCYSIASGLWIWYLTLIVENQIMGKNGCPLIE
jgi:hypothetical protein